MNIPQFCHCDCHKILWSTAPPKCYCTCRYMPNSLGETLSFCKHNRPTKFGCTKCYAEIYNKELEVDHIELLEKMNNSLVKRVEALEKNVEDNRDSWIILGNKYDHCQDGIDKCFEKIEMELSIRRCELTEAVNLYRKLEKSRVEHNDKIEDSLVKHKQNCEWLDKLDKSLNTLTDMHKHISSTVGELEDYNIRQVDENHKASAKMENLKTLIHDETHDRGNIWSRLEYLENFEDSIKKAPHPKLLNARLKELEAICASRIANENGILYKCEKCDIPVFESTIKDIKLHNDFNVICHGCFCKLPHL